MATHLCQSAYAGAADLQRMTALAHATAMDNLHVVDLPYRLCSWASDDPANVGLWVDDAGQLRAWAVLQTPFWALDYAYDPGLHGDMHRQILAWADQRAQHTAGAPGGHPCWFVNVFGDQQERIGDLVVAGFADQAHVAENAWAKVFMERPAHAAPGDHPLPAGFRLRPLHGEPEVDAYVALHRAAFGSANMTREWRRRTLQRPEYAPDLDLVIEGPDGSLVAFCVCWFDPAGRTGRPAGQVEPIGVHPDFQRLGLGRAILAEGICRLMARGAEVVYVESDDDRQPVFHFYRHAGFHVLRDVHVFRKDYPTAKEQLDRR